MAARDMGYSSTGMTDFWKQRVVKEERRVGMGAPKAAPVDEFSLTRPIGNYAHRCATKGATHESTGMYASVPILCTGSVRREYGDRV